MHFLSKLLGKGVTQGEGLQTQEGSILHCPVAEDCVAHCGVPHSLSGVDALEGLGIGDELSGAPVHAGPAVGDVHHIDEVAVVELPGGGELDLVGVVDLVAYHIVEVGAEVEAEEVAAYGETAGEVRGRIADDLAVGDGDLAVLALDVLELQCAGTHVGVSDDGGAVHHAFLEDPLGAVPVEVADLIASVAAVAVHVAERLAHLDDVVVADFGGSPVGLCHDALKAAEAGDLILVVGDVAADVEGEVLGRYDGSVEGELYTAVAGGTHVLVLAVITRTRDGEVDEEVLGIVLIDFQATGERALEEAEVESDIVGVGGLPGEVGVVHDLACGEDVLGHGEPGGGG